MKIAVCDDNINDLSNVVSILDNYKNLHKDNNLIEYTSFSSAADLISAMERGQQYEVVLLDILMPFITGMDAAKEIRTFNQDIKIIFMTSTPEFAVQSYTINAYYYALKPIWKEKLYVLLDKLFSEIEVQIGSSILVKGKNGISRIYIHRLEYAEVIGRSIHYHLIDGSVIEAPGAISALEKELIPIHYFIKPHRSFIINPAHIASLGQRDIKMQSNSLIPMAKVNSAAVKAAYIAYTFNN